MPNFKKHKFRVGHVEEFTEMVKISADGHFYCNVPATIYPLIDRRYKKSRSQSAISCETFERLITVVNEALEKSVEPTVKKENVILYNIESHVSFAEMPNGDITPNAVPEGAEWTERDGRYGNQDATHRAYGGYSLTIGAQAFTKITTSYGDIHNTEYELYYGKGSHLDAKCPASLLNSWCAFNLPEEPREMPYTDEAATFFHNLMLAIAELSRKIQSFTFEERTLLDIIAKGTKLLT